MWWSCWMGSKSCPRLPVSWIICLKEAECSTEGDDMAFPSERCASLQKFCTPYRSEHCPETQLGRFLCSTSLQNFIWSHWAGGWKSVRWGNVLSPSLVQRELGIAVPAVKGYKKMGSNSGAVFPQAMAPGQPLQGHLLCSCLRHCWMWRVQAHCSQTASLQACHFFFTYIKCSMPALAETVMQPAYTQGSSLKTWWWLATCLPALIMSKQ